MGFPTRHEKPVISCLQLDGVTIDFCDSVKYLSVLADNELPFDGHIQNTLTKACAENFEWFYLLGFLCSFILLSRNRVG